MELLIEKHLQRLIHDRNGWSELRLQLCELSHRWQWWCLVLQNKRVPPATVLAYPKIDFIDHFSDSSLPMRMLKDCLDRFHDVRFDDFLDWILYRCGDPQTKELPRNLRQKHVDHWTELFDLKMLLDHPGDWLGHYYEQNIISRSGRKGMGFFSTPMNLCTMICQMVLTEKDLLAEVNEPCVGTGRFLMAASNYCLHLSGQDINQTVIKICKINGWLYIPSLVIPCRELKKSRAIELPKENIQWMPENQIESPQLSLIP